uniref:Timeless N-terminal domain-containing protein n=1 Tax=Amphimedon queenslandica TaxID=400682 RepID=A0A1X7TDN5_AMPQE
MSSELVATYSALGTKDGDQYYKGPECLACVKDLIRALRYDDDLCGVRRHLGKARILQKATDLQPVSIVDDKVFLQFVKVLDPKKGERAEVEGPEVEQTTSSSTMKQLSIGESLQRTRSWDINDPKSQAVHQKVGEMIALDFQTLSIVDDRGFASLVKLLEPRYVLPSRRYISGGVLPQIYDGIAKEVTKELDSIISFSFTTDI